MDRIEDDIRQASEVEPKVRAIPGNKGLYYFMDRATGHSVSISLFETEEAMVAAADQARSLRQELTEPTGARITSVDEYEIVVMPSEMRAMMAA
jgi:hypothetical protein